MKNNKAKKVLMIQQRILILINIMKKNLKLLLMILSEMKIIKFEFRISKLFQYFL